MTSLLQKGIAAARNGNHTSAKEYLVQVLQQDPRNEQAWLWLSEVVDTLGEQIQCIEQVLKLNPDNDIAKRALQKLKAQPRTKTGPLNPAAVSQVNQAAVMPIVQTSAGIAGYPQQITNGAIHAAATRVMPAITLEERRPYRLDELHAAPRIEPLTAVATTNLPSMPLPDMPMPQQNGVAKASLSRQVKRATAVQSAAQIAPQPSSKPASTMMQPVSAEGPLPLLPMLIFGALSVTAVGGLLMIMLLIAFT